MGNTTGKPEAIHVVNSRTNGIGGLVTNGTFKLVNKDELQVGTLIFRSLIVDESKSASICVHYTSRLVAQNYGDDDAAEIATEGPTVSRFI